MKVSLPHQRPSLTAGPASSGPLPLVPAGPLAERSRPRGPVRVLVVDDHRDSADSLAALLEVQGYAVQTAYSGSHALQLASAFNPDVVVCDLAMPGMDGFAVGEGLRRDPHFSHCRFIAYSGYGDSTVVERARRAGFHCHLLKPAPVEELLQHLPPLASPAALPGVAARPRPR